MRARMILFLIAAGLNLIFGMMGTLNLAHLAVAMPAVSAEHPDLVAAVAGLFLVSFGIKAGLFPLYFWLPSSYHTPPVAVSSTRTPWSTHSTGARSRERRWTCSTPSRRAATSNCRHYGNPSHRMRRDPGRAPALRGGSSY